MDATLSPEPELFLTPDVREALANEMDAYNIWKLSMHRNRHEYIETQVILNGMSEETASHEWRTGFTRAIKAEMQSKSPEIRTLFTKAMNAIAGFQHVNLNDLTVLGQHDQVILASVDSVESEDDTVPMEVGIGTEEAEIQTETIDTVAQLEANTTDDVGNRMAAVEVDGNIEEAQALPNTTPDADSFVQLVADFIHLHDTIVKDLTAKAQAQAPPNHAPHVELFKQFGDELHRETVSTMAKFIRHNETFAEKVTGICHQLSVTANYNYQVYAQEILKARAERDQLRLIINENRSALLHASEVEIQRIETVLRFCAAPEKTVEIVKGTLMILRNTLVNQSVSQL